MAILHARFWCCDGDYDANTSRVLYDPHEFGLKLMASMAYIVDWDWESQVCGVSLDGVVVNHHEGDGFGHQVHVAATALQWEAMRRFLEDGMNAQS